MSELHMEHGVHIYTDIEATHVSYESEDGVVCAAGDVFNADHNFAGKLRKLIMEAKLKHKRGLRIKAQAKQADEAAQRILKEVAG